MLSVIRANYPDRQQEMKDAAFLKAARNTLIRQKGVCTKCAFSAGKFSRVIEPNNSYGHINESTLETVCAFCFYAHRLELADERARIIYLPEIDQVQLNYIVHGCWSILSREDELENSFCYSVRTSLSLLLERTEPVEMAFNSKLASHPKHLAQMLKSCTDEEYAARDVILKDMRLLPIRQGFEDELTYWQKAHYQKMINEDASKWEAIGSRIGRRTLTGKP
jgi:intracellular multiplication protein IcmJ